jgi:hypothetical protein
MNHDLMAVYAASEIVELLTLCQELQSEKDGRNDRRPAHTPAMRMRLPNVSVPHAGTPCCCAACCR